MPCRQVGTANISRSSSALPELPDLSTLDHQLAESLRLFAPEDAMSAADACNPAPDDADTSADDSCPWQQCCPDWAGPVHKVVDWRQAEDFYEGRQQLVDLNELRRLGGVMSLLRKKGEYRKLIPVPSDWKAGLKNLEADFPNFCEVIEYLEVMYSLAEYHDGVVRFDPILLNGEPGCGKSYFAERLADFIGAGNCTVRMETAQSSGALVGTSDFWSNTKPGHIFRMLIENDWANTCFILDEVEKGTRRDYDPTMALLSLFEAGTARVFTDLSCPWLTLDASAVLWIGTSNEASLLPEPVLDRMRRFEIGPLTDDHALKLIKRMFDQLVGELNPKAGKLKMSPSLAEHLVGLSPRRIKRVLREAVGRALYDCRTRLLPRDIVIDTDDQLESKPSIGFL